jgi:DNA-binding response OmpR family regulator
MKRILIIEDDQKIAMALALRLKQAGYEATAAFDALTGLYTATKVQPDLVLLDITMPGGDGFSVAEKFRQRSPKVPIMFLTASKRPGLVDRAQALGAVGFFEKPYDPRALLCSISRALGVVSNTHDDAATRHA